MSFGGFIGSYGGGSSGGGGGSGDAKMISDGLYNSIIIPTASMNESHMVTPLISRPVFNTTPLSLTIVCPPLFFFPSLYLILHNKYHHIPSSLRIIHYSVFFLSFYLLFNGLILTNLDLCRNLKWRALEKWA